MLTSEPTPGKLYCWLGSGKYIYRTPELLWNEQLCLLQTYSIFFFVEWKINMFYRGRVGPEFEDGVFVKAIFEETCGWFMYDILQRNLPINWGNVGDPNLVLSPRVVARTPR